MSSSNMIDLPLMSARAGTTTNWTGRWGTRGTKHKGGSACMESMACVGTKGRGWRPELWRSAAMVNESSGKSGCSTHFI
eukprot:1154436-Pelagomonas_calceolata.AAC.1